MEKTIVPNAETLSMKPIDLLFTPQIPASHIICALYPNYYHTSYQPSPPGLHWSFIGTA